MKRRIIAGLMAVLVVVLGTGLHSGLAAQREDNPIEPQYTHILNIMADLKVVNGIADCYGNLRGRYTNTTMTMRVALQKRVIGTKAWLSVCSWSSESEKAFIEIEKQQAISSGYDYRVYVSCTIRDSEGVIKESAGRYSSTIRYPHS